MGLIQGNLLVDLGNIVGVLPTVPVNWITPHLLGQNLWQLQRKKEMGPSKKKKRGAKKTASKKPSKKTPAKKKAASKKKAAAKKTPAKSKAAAKKKAASNEAG